MTPATERLQNEIERLGIRNALVTTFHFNSYNGSPLVALDVACALRGCGVDATIATFALGEPMRARASAAGVRTVDLDVISGTLDLDDSYDLVWGQHWPVHLIVSHRLGVRARYLVMSSLSPFEPLESIPPSAVGADLVVFNSAETLRARGQTVDPLRRGVLPNSLDPRWFVDADSAPADAPVAVVSNNLSPDIDAALRILAAARPDIGVRRIGQRHEALDVSPDFVDGVRALVTIGHTVQKGLSRCRPVYVYDRFGGPGWLTASTFDAAMDRNFSGRGFGFKSPETIASELAAGPPADETAALRARAIAEFDLPRNLAALLARLAVRQSAPEAARDHSHDLAAAEQIANLFKRRAAFPIIAIPGAEIVLVDVEGFNDEARHGRPGIKRHWASGAAARQYCAPGADVIVEGVVVLTEGLPHSVSLRWADQLATGVANLPSPSLTRFAVDDARFLNAKFEVRLPGARLPDQAMLQAHGPGSNVIELGLVRFRRVGVRGA